MSRLELTYEQVYDLVHKMCTRVSPDNLYLLKKAAEKESNVEAKTFLETMVKNVALAGEKDKPVCQSPGYPSVWIRWGEAYEPNLTNIMGNITKAVQQATLDGYIRPSIVHPLTRVNPGDSSGRGVPNFELRYDKDLPYVEIVVSAKGCGAELPNVAKILTPATLGKNYKGLKKLVLDTITGSNGFIGAHGFPCPPFSLGIGIGGQMDVAAKLSREAISTRNWLDHNPDPLFDSLEQELLADINKLGNGPAGIGGDTTALAVKIAWASTHTAICPVVINFHCWVARRFGLRFYPDGHVEELFQVKD
ncbi:MAG: fumarate hydratase [Sutterellaceae bacterium]|nr:fumarate hydratase [Sutterellaceae bacterium]MDD7441379.1 fumarate hydratase [Sutterellaceae bacterium]MDY2867481.1 fumarate hydratase [Mesosutterella sp.]